MTTNYEELKLDIESNNRQTNISNNQETITQENLLKKRDEYYYDVAGYYTSALSLVSYYIAYSGGSLFGFVIIFLSIFGLLSSWQIDFNIQFLHNNKFTKKTNRIFEKFIFIIMNWLGYQEILQIKFINNFFFTFVILILSIYYGIQIILDKKYFNFALLTIFLSLHIALFNIVLKKLYFLLEHNMIN